ncbi:hypothetical protein PHMEG_00033986, partial [Phytophthora megakarya]
ELVSGRRQLAANWLTKTPGTDLIPHLASERKKLVVASDMCKTTPCMDGVYNVLFLGKVKNPGHIHPWRLVDLPAREYTCGNWQDREFPCAHAVPAAIKDGERLESLYIYNAKRMSIHHFKDMYSAAFRPWLTNVTLKQDTTLKTPAIQSEPLELGKRGVKPGPKPKHKRKKAYAFHHVIYMYKKERVLGAGVIDRLTVKPNPSKMTYSTFLIRRHIPEAGGDSNSEIPDTNTPNIIPLLAIDLLIIT